jgi:2-polyprenyl-3-methyl-5-hydroxy-6-metoxy-1,4-benzoquinol methylase
MKETLERKTSWNILDKFLSQWRAKFILPYLNQSSVLCDIGCGQEGKILVSVADRIKEGYGFDFNLKSDVRPKKNVFLSNRDFLQCENKFDIIILLAVLEHLPYPDSVEKMLSGIYEKLNDDGVFIMTTPDRRAKWLLEFLAYKLHIINEEEIRDHKHYFDRVELLEFIKKSGFNEVKHKYFQFRLNNLVICKK